MCLLKLNPILNDTSREVPIAIKIKLVEVFFSYLPLTADKPNLSVILKREFTKLYYCQDVVKSEILRQLEKSSPSTRKLFDKIFTIDGDDTQDDLVMILSESSNLKIDHQCPEIIQQFEVETYSPEIEHEPIKAPKRKLSQSKKEELEKILSFAKSLKNHKYSSDERDVIREISEVFGRIADNKS